MASCCIPDIEAWIQNLPPISKWTTDSISTCICSSSSSSTSSLPSLNLVVTKSLHPQSLSFSIIADVNISNYLWTSKPIKITSKSTKLADEEETLPNLLTNVIETILNYGTKKKHLSLRIPKISKSRANFNSIFNLSLLTLTLLVCIYEAPTELRFHCLNTLKNQLVSSKSREVSKVLMRFLGSNIEEQWMRSLNLAITNWILETRAANHSLRAPCPLFSYAISAAGLWKVQLYCPVIAMDVEKSSGSPDEQLLFSLRYHQLEGVLQFNHRVIVQDNWADVIVSTDNIRFDVIRLVNEALLKSQGAGAAEKHFPSRISLQITPCTLQADILSISVSKSSENPAREVGIERSLEGSLEVEAPTPHIGLTVAAGETVTMTLKPWKFEQSVYGNSAILNWFLHDSADGKEVFSSRPSKRALLHPKSWFKNRYSSAYRPFTRQGGVIFARDEYGDRVRWKVCRAAAGKNMEWEVRGCVWLTYWPNKHRTFYNETRMLKFKETLHLTLA